MDLTVSGNHIVSCIAYELSRTMTLGSLGSRIVLFGVLLADEAYKSGFT